MTNNMHEANRRSWNRATAQHLTHRPDLIEKYRAGWNNLYPEEIALLGDIKGKNLVHLQCNDGQDTLSIANHLGAIVTGVDISDTAIEFAQRLSAGANIPATFIRSDLFAWFDTNTIEYDVVFTSYGALNWLSDIKKWGQGVAKSLKSGGHFAMMEFHPFMLMHLSPDDDSGEWKLSADYMGGKPIEEQWGVGDYVGEAGNTRDEAIARGTFQNPDPSYEFPWGVADIVTALLEAGLMLTHLQEFPYCNGWRPFENMRQDDDYRNYPPNNMPQTIPLMLGIRAIKR